MLFQIISDLHLEYYDTMPNLNAIFIKKADNLILSGDICYYAHPNFDAFFEIVSKQYKLIFFIPGNHEYYSHIEIPNSSFDKIDLMIENKLSKYPNIFFMQKSFYEFDNFIIAGTTMWCKTEKTFTNNPNVKLLSTPEFVKLNNKIVPNIDIIKKINHDQYNWLESFVYSKDKNKKPLVILTHYLPSIKCINEKYKNNTNNDYYFTECDHLFKYVNYWISGHTHEKVKLTVDKCQIHINPYGTPKEEKNYIKDYVIDIK